MPITELAEQYLATFREGKEFPQGIAYLKALHQCDLDYSPESLKRIDRLLDQIHAKQAPKYEEFIREAPNQTFLYFLAFYVGKTIEHNSGGAAVVWLRHEEMVERDPSIAAMWPLQFESSVICEVTGGSAREGLFLPLSSIVIRLFEGSDEKSVWFSADAYMADQLPPATPAYHDGQPVQKGDALLYGGGFFPARVEGLGASADPGVALLMIDVGTEEPSALPVESEKLVLVERNTRDFGSACAAGAAWLERLAFAKPPAAGLYGTEHALHALGVLYSQGLGVKRNAGDAIELWRAGTAKGYAACEHAMALAYDAGEALPRDPDKALKMYKSAADKGYARAQFVMGTLYESGRLVPWDIDAAIAWYRKGAERGSAGAQQRLAMCYQDGRGVPRDYAQCVHWYRLAAAQGDAISINNLADKYENGTGVPRDLQKAFDLYTVAAGKNVIAAWYSLGCMYQEGRGVPRDRGKAIGWLQRAAEHEFLDSAARLAELQRARP
jgi:TPR repeat protein